MKPYPTLCMKCKTKKARTAGKLRRDAVLTAWHYVCYNCGWKAKWGKYEMQSLDNS